MSSNASESRELDAGEELGRWLGFLRRSLRFWPIPLFALLLGALAAGAYLRWQKPRYRSETVILYVERGRPTDAGEPANTSRSVSVRLKELLMSRAKLERVVSEFDLYSDVKRRSGTVEAVDELKRTIDFRAPGGDTFSIAFEGGSPSEAQHVTAALARLVIDGDAELRREQARVGLEFLVTEKQGTETRLRDAEQQLALFMAQHPRFALDTAPLSNGAAVRASLAAEGADGKLGTRTFGLPAARAGGANAPQPTLTRDSTVGSTDATADGTVAEAARARAALAAAQENLSEQLAHYTPAHPDVRAARTAVERATARVAALPPQPTSLPGPAPDFMAPPVVARPRMVAAAVPRAFPLAGAGAPLVKGTDDVVGLETDWLTRTRAVTEARQRQDQIEAQLFKADILSSSESAGHGVQVNVIDPAFLPQRALPPGRSAIVSMFLGAALLLGLLGALARAALDERVFVASDLAGIALVLAEIPKLSLKRGHRVTS